jgi:ABC-type nitrate/sulfonate/bicarbonate transport system substrate-binding protein
MTATTPTRGRVSRLAGLAAAVIALAVAVAACGEDGSSGGTGGAKSTGDTVNIVAFKAPSLGAFLPAVIEDRGLDTENGIDLKFTYTTPDNYNAEFAAGHYDVGGSAALLSEALRTERDVGVTYLFNLFDFFGAVVTGDDGIQRLPDLEGKSLAAATGTTNYAMFQWFAQQQGLDLDKVETVNQTTAGLSTMAISGRTDATELWEPAYSTLLDKKPDIKTLDMGIDRWKQEFGTESIPYLGVAAQQKWVDAHPDAVKKMYATYKAAADWITQNPNEAAAIIAKTIPNADPAVIQGLIERNERLGLSVQPSSEVADGIRAVFEAGQQTGYLKKDPPDSLIYKGLAQ